MAAQNRNTYIIIRYTYTHIHILHCVSLHTYIAMFTAVLMRAYLLLPYLECVSVLLYYFPWVQFVNP